MAKIAFEPDTRVLGKKLTRRDFLKKGGAAVALGTAGLAFSSRVFATPTEESATTSGVKYAMVIDLDRCFGCRSPSA